MAAACQAVIDGKRCTDTTLRRVLGYCIYHYRQKAEGRPFRTYVPRRQKGRAYIRDESGNKECGKCGCWLPTDNFGSHGGAPDRLQVWCHGCMADAGLLAKYGLTRRAVEEMIEEQGGCSICRRVELDAKDYRRIWHVDHDHACCPGEKTCGRCVRSILCARCNKMIGQAGDSAALLRAAADYIDDHEAAHDAGIVR